MKRPLAITIVMWFAILYAIGSCLGIAAALLGVGQHYAIGGLSVTRERWLVVAAPLVAMIAILMGLSAIGFWRHRKWARLPFMCIWPVIVFYGLTNGFLHTIPWILAWRAVIEAVVVGSVSGWLLFRYRRSVSYFANPPHPNR